MSAINKPSPAITVIICMYKGEATVSRMIDCVLNQTFKDFELMLVDDGSPDRCGEIAEEYARKDSRVRVLHKSNGGLADARNKALAIAQGEYTIQFDQDDWVELNCLEEMYAKAKEDDADMLICDNFRNDGKVEFYGSQKPTVMDHQVVMKDILVGELYGYCWNKLIRLNVYKKYGILFPTEFYGCEDQYGMCAMLKNEIKVSYLPQAYYHYVTYPDSLSRHYDETTYQNDLVMRDMFVKLFSGTPYKELAFERKTSFMFGRAFTFGRKFFTSKQFLETFGEYEQIVFAVPRKKSFNLLYNLAFRGHYQLARTIYGFLFTLKQIIKK